MATSIIDNLDNYIVSLEKTIENLKLKGEEFISFNTQIPEKEKILRSIERELEIKESLFLLLLQKREEASINFAVVKPSVKVIDVARPSYNAVSPNVISVYLTFLLISILIPTFLIFIIFSLDNKLHTKQQLLELTNDKIQIWGEIPFIDEAEVLNSLSNSTSRSSLAESLRMVLANMKYSFAKYNDKKSFVTLVTSSIKGEGKTLISSNLSALLASSNKKTILLGADLRNPQIHKITNLDKNTKGLSDLLYKGNIEHYNKYLVNVENLDILLSGTIPPNPTELLTFDDRFSRLINILREEYVHIIIDSAPCLLVSDTFEISKNVDNTLYVLRANYTDKNLVSYINENISSNKLKDASIILNAVGNSSKYGYKYGYQYGYQYGYKYSYNYGYGYGYGSSSDKE